MPQIKNFNYAAKSNRVFVVYLRVEKIDGYVKKTRLKVESNEAIKAAKEAEKIILEKWKHIRSVKYLHIEDTADWSISY